MLQISSMAEKNIHWYLVFSSLEKAIEQVPDKRAVRVELDDKQFCLARSGERFFAFEDKCPHQGVPLNKGKIEEENFVCPWHRYAFNLKNGREKNNMCDVLSTYQVKIENNKVLIGIPAKSKGLLSWLGLR